MRDEWIIFCFDPLPWSTYLWIIMNFFTFIICLFGPYFIYLTWSKMKQNTLLKCICTAISVFFMSSTVIMSIHITSSFYCIYDFQIWLNQGLSALFFNQLGISLLYLLFVIRLIYPFKGTTLETSQLLFYFFIFGFVLMLVFGSLVIVIFYSATMEQWNWAYNAMIAFQTTYLLFTVILLSVFVNKMLLVQDIDATLLQKIVRIIICAAMGLLSSQLASILSVMRTIYGTNEYLFVTHVMLLVLDQFINLLSIYLQFPFGKQTFTKICGKCAKFCSKHVISYKSELKIESHPTPDSFNSSSTTKSTNDTHTSTWASPDFIANTKSENITNKTITISSTPKIAI